MKKYLLAVLMVLPMLVYAEECGQPDLTKPCMKWDIPAKVMFWSLASANAADYASTRWALAQGAREANPIMAPLFRHEPAGAIVKLGIGTSIAYLTYRGIRDQRKSVRWVSFVSGAVTVGLYAWVVKHNIGVANELKRRQRGDFR